ncbi:MAG TPA: glutaminyl-peptide cyclotransferase, partial [Humidesulfovibrio sp.]|uniref:glutaminyl-peptide cyclotransferase n=1 Tax=Humidesulfovibrio sp. TaxID=2910988 RepID=UPI002D1460C5
SLRRVDPATGRALARVELPRKLFGEGLALCPEAAAGGTQRLLQLTWREGLILAYAPDTLRLLSRHRLRGQGWGLACKDAELTLSDGTATLRFLDAQSLAETGRTLRVCDGGQPVDRLNELEWVNGWLLANVWQEDRIAVIRPDTGQVALWLDLAPLRHELSELSGQGSQAAQAEAANGIAFDPKADQGRGALLLTGKRWDTVFVTALPERVRRPPEASGGQPLLQMPTAPAKPH